MEYTRLKNSELIVSRLCVGGCPMGGHGWGKTSRDDLIQAVNTAIYEGINFFDTADIYGLGESETVLGEALKGERQNAVIATKFGVRRDNNGNSFYDNSPGWIQSAIEGSLKRLGTDYIDLYQIHYRDGKTSIHDVVNELEKLKQKGLIRCYGLSNIYIEDIPELNDVKNYFTSFQDEYSLANRSNENEIMKISSGLNLSPLAWGSLGQGVLTGKYNGKTKFKEDDRRSREIYQNFHGTKFQHNLKIVETLNEISSEINKPIPAIALRWILDYIPESVVLAGVKTSTQIESNMQGLGWSLRREHINLLEKVSEYGGELVEQS
ncbi:aldo/keto reductase [Fredinandcohnia quinoae]|uniref:Aldo/keto reductase n=1 Tax=Fredinandcohnia quinoae TaxID=2918902 RepID=A0AAW5E7Y2_9BACI|nr:aldo/keto reductase [Fredinandcohnia sp. SECRCQ15]MCH1624894.1 aldo/keto reductase [Fredinandcohnia sp. SECRCQ15]